MNAVLKVGRGLGALTLVVAMFSSCYTLKEGEQAVIVQFGRPVGAPVTLAGLHVKLPFVQEVRRFEKRILIIRGLPVMPRWHWIARSRHSILVGHCSRQFMAGACARWRTELYGGAG